MTDAAISPNARRRIGDVLVQQGVITDAQLANALEQQKQAKHMLGQVLVEMGLITETDMLRVLSEQLKVPLVDLRHYQLAPEQVRILPEAHARRYRAIVMHEEPDGLLVGMVDPTNIFVYDRLSQLLKRPIKPALVSETDLLQAIDLVYRRTGEIFSLAEEMGEELSDTKYDMGAPSVDPTLADAPVVRLLNSIFEDALQVKASDIHIEPEEHLLRVRQRIDGFLHEQTISETRIASALVTRLKLMAGLDISEKRLPQDGRFQMTVKDTQLDVRVSTMPIQNGESVVLRLLDQSLNFLSLEQLGMQAQTLTRFRRLISQPHGMILVTGPTGSGKTTTLYAALNEINRPEHKIITVEDPVEYRLPRINQVQVNPKIELSFARILRSALRQDPDIIMVGEMRDAETVEIGIRAAMTGHLVFSTLHTNDAITTVNRLVDMGAKGYMVATALEAAVAQRLLRRICANCVEPYKPLPGQLAWAKAILGDAADSIKYKHGAGCAYCNHTGYRGRVGIYEMLEIDGDMADALRRDDWSSFERAAHAQASFRPLVQSGLDLVRQGMTSLTEVIRVVAGDLDLGAEPPTTAAPKPAPMAP